MNFASIIVPHERQRYPTVGDWQLYGDNVLTTISGLGNDDFEFLVKIHEEIEAYLCIKRGITQDRVDAYDIAYEDKRPDGDDSEPGDQPDAPYHEEHRFATNIERLIADELGVNWEEYNSSINTLP